MTDKITELDVELQSHGFELEGDNMKYTQRDLDIFDQALQLMQMVRDGKITAYRVAKLAGVEKSHIVAYQKGKSQMENATYKGVKNFSDTYQKSLDWLEEQRIAQFKKDNNIK